MEISNILDYMVFKTFFCYFYINELSIYLHSPSIEYKFKIF